MRAAAMVTAFALVAAGCDRTPAPARQGVVKSEPPVQGQEVAASATAPRVPPPIARKYPTKVLLDIEIREHVGTLASGVQYLYWTFGDDAPGAFYRVREGDLVEVHLHNHPDNSLAHDIDFQAAAGPGGGGEASFVAPGSTTVFAWRARRPGLYLYQCSAAPAGVHVANGMFGLVLVEPKEGMPKVDREYQIVQSEFYTEGKFGETGPQRFSQEKALKEQPEYVVFNGSVGAIAGDRALIAAAGERIRVFFGNAGPNLAASFHVAGALLDEMRGEGGPEPDRRGRQVTSVPPGDAAILELDLEVPGAYPIVDRALFRAGSKGAAGLLRVEGAERPLVFSGKTSETPYEPGTKLASTAGFGPPTATDGGKIFATICATCHQAGGQGVPKAFPPLRESDFLAADRERAIRIVMSGLRGPITVNGSRYDAVMPNPGLNDQQIAAVLSYVLTNLGNRGVPVTADEVAKLRKGWDGASPVAADKAPLRKRARPVAPASFPKGKR